jgi:hypothetical protein
MDDIARWPVGDRRQLFQEAAARLGLAPVVIEKDFWVCWTLKRLFERGADLPRMLFKGGTSLSKAFDLIRRFSEDIDLALDRHDLGFIGARDPLAEGLSANARKRLVADLRAACATQVQGPILEGLQTAASATLGVAGWAIALDATDTEGQTLLFTYPSALPAPAYGGVPYVRPRVILEFGATSDHDLVELKQVQPYAATAMPDPFRTPAFDVTVMAVERTFWEKVTILHEKHHRGVRDAERVSRHYSDVARLHRTTAGVAALGNLALLERVARHKTVFFPAGGAHYDEARAGTLRLLPSEPDRVALKADYGKMREMFFDEPPPFDNVMQDLADLEIQINGR